MSQDDNQRTNPDAEGQPPSQLDPGYDEASLGLAGRTARFFIRSPLSPLLYVAMLLMGLLGLVATPRQEDPQISVPMIDVMVAYPGASAEQVSNLAIQPLERIMSEIPGVKHVYSASQRGQGIVTVEFEVGEEMGPSLVKVNDKLASNMDKIPPGVMPPLVKTKGIDDVPIVTLTLWSKDTDGNGRPDVDDGQLRLLAQDVLQVLKEVKNTGNAFIVGGRREQITVDAYPERLSGFEISLGQVADTIRTANAETTAGGVESSGSHFSVTSGSFLTGADDINRLVVGTFNEIPVYVYDIARVTFGPEDATQLVAYYTGPAAEEGLVANGAPAVTIAIAKKQLTNGVTVADAIIDKVEELRGTRIPNNVEVSITRNYGETANEKVSELIFKLFIATFFVFLLVLAAFRALKPAIVVMLVIPVVLLMTIFVAWITNYTIDRVSLFALIFSIGILVDDAIVVVENIYRRWLEEGGTDEHTAVDAVREVGNPTILATFTVIAALLPMGFVSGMMGPYMEPIPALGSVAMLISLFAAFVFTPYLAISNWLRPSMRYLEVAEKREHREAEGLERLYVRILTPLIENRRKRTLFRLILWGSFLFTCMFFYFKWVPVKMLPLDNKPEFSVVLDMPEGTALPVTANLAHRMAERLRNLPEVTSIQLYAGTARPFDFNGMVRHYYLRSDPWLGEIQVQLTNKHDRDRSSHEIAVEAREMLKSLADEYGARYAVVEMPPGPPVLQAVVAEVHGPSADVRRDFARDLTEIFAQAESARDVDNYMRERYDYWRFDVDTEKAVRRGISVDTINQNLAMALGGVELGDVKMKAGHEPIRIVVQVPLSERSQIDTLGDLPVHSNAGFTVPLRELGTFQRVPEEDIIYRKDLRGVEYVVADVGGDLAAPVYAMFQIEDILEETGYTAPDGVKPVGFWLGPPPTDQVSAWEWAGEWTVTFETFRDMGAAFMVALVLIYILVVWEFGNFRIPLVIMAPIPLTLLGIIPAHFLMFQLGLGGEFTATSMIGWIALAGIIVRNSILLVDFSIHELQKGVSVAESVIRACKTRTRPIVITALALVAGSSVIFTDPIFQGMAISLASGVLVSTILTLIVIPLGCVAASRDLCEVAVASAPSGVAVPCADALPSEQFGQEQDRKRSARSSDEPGAIAGVLAKVGAALMLVLYFFRGIGLLLLDAIKGWLKRRRRPGPPAGRPPSGSVGGPSSSPTTGGSGGSQATTGDGNAGVASDALGGHGAGAATKASVAQAAPTVRNALSTRDGASAATVEPETRRPKGALGGDAQPSNVERPKKRVAKKASRKKVTAKKAVPKPASARGPATTTAGKASASRSKKKAQPAVVDVAARIQKRAPRRGIRLKTDDGPGTSAD
jgi:multidrug efflux pump subunit AcrB